MRNAYPAIIWQRLGHGQRGGAGEHANLQDCLCPGQLAQRGYQLPFQSACAALLLLQVARPALHSKAAALSICLKMSAQATDECVCAALP